MIIVQYIYYLVSNYHYEFMGWDGLLLLNILHNNQLKEWGIQVHTMVTLPVHIFPGRKTNVRAIDSISFTK